MRIVCRSVIEKNSVRFADSIQRDVFSFLSGSSHGFVVSIPVQILSGRVPDHVYEFRVRFHGKPGHREIKVFFYNNLYYSGMTSISMKISAGIFLSEDFLKKAGISGGEVIIEIRENLIQISPGAEMKGSSLAKDSPVWDMVAMDQIPGNREDNEGRTA